MSDQSKLGLGQIITTEQNRDAIHVAVAPVTVAFRTFPGEHVGLNEEGEATTKLPSSQWIGVIDPFLPDGTVVQKGQRVWLYLYPGSITSLRHEWTHPAFSAIKPGNAEVARDPEGESRLWMENWAMKHMGEDYYGDSETLTVAQAFANAIKAGEDCHIGPYESAREYIDDEWWGHWERLTGKRGHRGKYFSCSC